MPDNPLPPSVPVTLPFSPEPAQGESFVGYLVRLASGLAVPVPVVVHRLGLSDAPTAGRMPQGVGLVLEPGQADVAGAVLRRDPGAVAGMLLTALPSSWTRLDPSLPTSDLLAAAATGGRVLPSWSRCCPACLTDRPGVWSLRWRLVATFACVGHGVLLNDRCAVCSAPVLSGSSPNEYGTPTKPGGSAHLDASRVPSPGCCPAPVRGEGRRCGAPYADQRAVVVRDHPGLVDAQRLVDAASSAGDRDAADDLHALAVLWALTADDDELAALPAPPAAEREGRRRSRVLTRPGNTGVAAAAFRWALSARGDATPDGADAAAVRERLARRTPDLSAVVPSTLSPYSSPLLRRSGRAKRERVPPPPRRSPAATRSVPR